MNLEVQTRHNNGGEKRYLPRWEIQNRVSFQFPEERDYHYATTRDLSCSGVCITTEENIHLGQKLKLTIELSQHSSVTLWGQVVWIKSHSIKKSVGIDFLEPGEEIKETILQYAFEIDKEKVVKHWFQGW
jgi:Tfp pilus assembly protein PilZ